VGGTWGRITRAKSHPIELGAGYPTRKEISETEEGLPKTTI
jgi:hypothetical protein